MNSNDVFVVINGQSFRIAGDTLKPAVSPFQSEVLKRLDGIESRLGAVEYEQRLLHSKIDGLQTSVYWVLAAIGIFMGALTLPSVIASIASTFSGKTHENTPPASQPIIVQLPPYPYIREQDKQSA